MNVGPGAFALLVTLAIAVTVYGVVRAFSDGHPIWALAIILLLGPGVLVAVLYLVAHPRPERKPAG